MIRRQSVAFNRLGSFGIMGPSDDEIHAIHLGTLEILNDVGVKVYSKEARDIFEGGGCRVEEESMIVHIPHFVVEEAINSAPSTILLGARNSENDFLVGGDRVGFTNFGEGIFVRDRFTKDYRDCTKKDLEEITRIGDALPELDMIWRAVGSRDQTQEIMCMHNAEAMINNTSKHVQIAYAGDSYTVERIYQMGVAVCGNEEKLQEHPIMSFCSCPTSLLKLIPDLTEVGIFAARHGIPMSYVTMVMMGSTAPMHMAGSLITMNAEILSAIVLSQLTKKGAPCIYGSSCSAMDFHHMMLPMGSPEMAIFTAFAGKLSTHYGLPNVSAGS